MDFSVLFDNAHLVTQISDNSIVSTLHFCGHLSSNYLKLSVNTSTR